MKRFWNIIIFPIIYISIMAIGMTVMHYGFGRQYGDSSMMNILVFVEIILSLFTIYAVKKYSTWKESGFDKISWKGFLWLVPIFIIMGIYNFQLFRTSFGNIDQHTVLTLAITAITIALVAFSEELMFRGILLNWSLKKYGVITSVLISAIGFSLLHSVNYFGGESLPMVMSQLRETFFFGLFVALLALKLKNIFPLIIIHFLWDFQIFASDILKFPVTGFTKNLLVSQILYQYIVTAILLASCIIIYIKSKKNASNNLIGKKI